MELGAVQTSLIFTNDCCLLFAPCTQMQFRHLHRCSNYLPTGCKKYSYNIWIRHSCRNFSRGPRKLLWGNTKYTFIWRACCHTRWRSTRRIGGIGQVCTRSYSFVLVLDYMYQAPHLFLCSEFHFCASACLTCYQPNNAQSAWMLMFRMWIAYQDFKLKDLRWFSTRSLTLRLACCAAPDGRNGFWLIRHCSEPSSGFVF